MEIIKRWCNNCKIEHIIKRYENQSEGIADVFRETYFSEIWKIMKKKSKQMPLEDFYKEVVFTAVYNYHRKRRRIRVAKNSIKPSD